MNERGAALTVGSTGWRRGRADAPKTCHNFYELAKRGYYNNTVFHRLVKVPQPRLKAVSRKLIALGGGGWACVRDAGIHHSGR